MQTPSHIIITAFGNHQLTSRGIKVNTPALLLGSALPDVPFALLTIGYEVYYRWLAPLPPNPYDSIMEYLHFDLFFTDPLWIISHNLFHSLVINGLLIVVGIALWRWGWGKRWGIFLFWLALSAQVHTVIDIFTHRSDGPLMFFPLNWTYRFQSPVSYWEPEAFGGLFIVFEYTLNLVLLVYLFREWYRNRKEAGG